MLVALQKLLRLFKWARWVLIFGFLAIALWLAYPKISALVKQFLPANYSPSAISLAFVFFALIPFSVWALWFIPKRQVATLKKHHESIILSSEKKPFQALDTPSPDERFSLENEARKTLAQIVGGVFVILGLFFTAENFQVTQQNAEQTQKGQVAERFHKALSQLSDTKPEIRLAGIYALEKIARENADDYHLRVIEILTAFVRENDHSESSSSVKDRTALPGKQTLSQSGENITNTSPHTDIRAIFTVLGRRSLKWGDKDNQYEPQSLDCSYTNLRGIKLNKDTANFSKVNFSGADLSGADLSGADLSGADLSRVKLIDAVNLSKADLSGANLSGADLSGTNLSGAKLKGANLSGAKLSRPNLSEADLHKADLRGVDLSKADLSKADLSGANLNGTNLSEAGLQRANFNEAYLIGANLSGADLSQADLIDARLYGAANLSRAILTRANLGKADLRRAILKEAKLNGWAILSGAILSEADLSGADLSGADLSGADLQGANLSKARLNEGTILSEADLSGADLSGADLQGANLSGAILSKTNLRGVDLSRADLSGTILTDTDLSVCPVLTWQQIDNAIINENTKVLPQFEEKKQEKLKRQNDQ